MFYLKANLVQLGYGISMGWLSMALPLLQSNESPLESGPITTEEISRTGSIIMLGALFGNFLSGYIVRVAGAKNLIFLLGIPQTVSICYLQYKNVNSFFLFSRLKYFI